MSLIYFISHPAVVIDPRQAIPEWDLSQEGLAAIEELLKQPWLPSIEVIYSSNEVKAKTGAHMIADKLGLVVKFREDLGEMNRSSTGYLKPEEFNETANQFFRYPDQSVRGWERAIDAQTRILKAVKEIMNDEPLEKNIAIMAHGGIGALFLSYLKHKPISRHEDQQGAGNYFVFDRQSGELIHGWRSITHLTP
jgi:broad specificity phosphatase PhoE